MNSQHDKAKRSMAVLIFIAIARIVFAMQQPRLRSVVGIYKDVAAMQLF
jgi:hypothetical protein